MDTDKIIKNENEENDDLIFYDTKDVARVLNCSIPAARDIMYRKDFPLIRVGKNLKVLKDALKEWAMVNRG